MKTGRPHMWIPSPMTIARDVQRVFVSCQQRIAAILQVGHKIDASLRINAHNFQKYPGRLSFATSAWTSPNNVPYMAVSVHLEEGGKPVSLFLDFTEVSKSQSGLNLAFEFLQILKNFGVEEKVGTRSIFLALHYLPLCSYSQSLAIMRIIKTSWWLNWTTGSKDISASKHEFTA
jgi:hypothetical protein